jgi:hypothetical protein
VLVPQTAERIGYLIQSRVPGYALPLTAPPLSLASEGMIHPVSSVEHIQVHPPTLAPCQHLFIIGVALRIRGKAHDAAILHIGDEAAEIPAEVTVRLALLHGLSDPLR